MSNLTVRANASGTGTVILESPNTNTNQTVTLPDASGTMLALASPAATGQFELSATNFLSTPTAGSRGVSPSMQFYRLDAGFVGTNATGAQSLLGVGVTLSASTVYAFEIMAYLNKSAGASAHTVALLYGGTATINNIAWAAHTSTNITANSFVNTATATGAGIITTTQTVSQSIASAPVGFAMRVSGTVSINAAGTFIPQYALSVAPGGAYTTQPGTYMLIYPIGVAGVSTNIGTWA